MLVAITLTGSRFGSSTQPLLGVEARSLSCHIYIDDRHRATRAADLPSAQLREEEQLYLRPSWIYFVGLEVDSFHPQNPPRISVPFLNCQLGHSLRHFDFATSLPRGPHLDLHRLRNCSHH
ncbi:hypothetical protein DTO166G4_6220 [Paecilomyces variotii]|nr:hypothetical protein DTO166G4_6220 [Paecilomyces variotii]KAJ9233636.1 hypothetical protein DTO166G5_5570 [Paecilomyces variotii]KAJ9249704.1 hypothetical protein DTO207G8_6491 [Paecilomyces variotii]KAJ9256367.1 hypothetical protein DTO195F2_5943 [Paecilomyces variotii]KAJ9348330.1 hypothetical protein DTO027B9_8353 [Paecilomyces variotii]